MSVTLLSILQIILSVILVILVLLQPPGNSSLSGFNNSQEKSLGLMIQIKSYKNPLIKITAIISLLFVINTLLLSGLCSRDINKKSIAEKILLEKKQENDSAYVPFEN